MARQKIDPEIMKFLTGSATYDYFAPTDGATQSSDPFLPNYEYKPVVDLTPKKSGVPELEPMAELPMPDGEQARQARRRSLLKQKRRRGRESTILSSPISLLSEEIGV